MKLRIGALMSVVLLFLAACAPTTITPQETEELFTSMPFPDAYAALVNTINTQPYPSNSSGWMITQSDQVGGFISAQLNYGGGLFGSDGRTGRVSVAMVQRSNGDTAVNLSLNADKEALKLAENIRLRLGLN